MAKDKKYEELAQAFSKERNEKNAQALVEYLNANSKEKFEVQVITTINIIKK